MHSEHSESNQSLKYCVLLIMKTYIYLIMVSGVAHLHGRVHEQDEDGHGVDGHEVAHHPPALLLAGGLALAPRVHTRHGPHTRHRSLCIIIIIVIYLLLLLILFIYLISYIGCGPDGWSGPAWPRVGGRGRVSVVASAGVNTRVTRAPLLQSVPDIIIIVTCYIITIIIVTCYIIIIIIVHCHVLHFSQARNT